MKRNAKAKPIRAKVFWAVSYGDGNIDPTNPTQAQRSDRRILRCAVHGGLAGVAQEGRKAVEACLCNPNA